MGLSLSECPFCGRWDTEAEVEGCTVCQKRARAYVLRRNRSHQSILDDLAAEGYLDRLTGKREVVILPGSIPEMEKT